MMGGHAGDIRCTTTIASYTRAYDNIVSLPFCAARRLRFSTISRPMTRRRCTARLANTMLAGRSKALSHLGGDFRGLMGYSARSMLIGHGSPMMMPGFLTPIFGLISLPTPAARYRDCLSV